MSTAESNEVTETSTSASPEIVAVEEMTTAVVREVIPFEDMAPFFDRAFDTLARAVQEQRVAVIGPSFARYFSEPAATVDLEAGFATDRALEPDGTASAGSLPAGRVARLLHTGSYDGIGSSWQRLQTWIAEQGMTPGPTLWEVYLVEPTPDMDPADLRTELNWALTD